MLELCSKILEDYPLEEILADNDLTVEEALEILVREGYVQLPEFIGADEFPYKG